MNDKLRKREWFVENITHSLALQFIREHHYARGGSLTGIYFHGLFQVGDPRLLGVAWWLPPTKVAAKSVSDDWTGVLCLTRLAIHPDVPTNGASFLLGQSVRRIRADGRFHTLLTYADEGEGHRGQIYRATNWEYLGVASITQNWVDADGKRVSPKRGPKSLKKNEMLALGWKQIGKSAKHKFVMRLR